MLHAPQGRADEETKRWFHRAFQPEPPERVSEDPYVLTVGATMPHGARARIDGGARTLEVIEAAVAERL